MLCSLRSSRLEVWEKEGGTGARGMTTGYGVGGASWTRVPLSCQAICFKVYYSVIYLPWLILERKVKEVDFQNFSFIRLAYIYSWYIIVIFLFG